MGIFWNIVFELVSCDGGVCVVLIDCDIVNMAASRVSGEELRSDLDRLQVALENLDSDLNQSTIITDMRDRYLRIYNLRMKSKNWLESKIYEDIKTGTIIKEQNLSEFISANTKPARYALNFVFCLDNYLDWDTHGTLSKNQFF